MAPVAKNHGGLHSQAHLKNDFFKKPSGRAGCSACRRLWLKCRTSEFRRPLSWYVISKLYYVHRGPLYVLPAIPLLSSVLAAAPEVQSRAVKLSAIAGCFAAQLKQPVEQKRARHPHSRLTFVSTSHFRVPSPPPLSVRETRCLQ